MSHRYAGVILTERIDQVAKPSPVGPANSDAVFSGRGFLHSGSPFYEAPLADRYQFIGIDPFFGPLQAGFSIGFALRLTTMRREYSISFAALVALIIIWPPDNGHRADTPESANGTNR